MPGVLDIRTDLASLPRAIDGSLQIVGFGSLLSEASARSTFPLLNNFRFVRIRDYRRVFTHPASIFFERGIADLPSLRMSSLSTESCQGASFVASVFNVSHVDLGAFEEREEEFDFVSVAYTPLQSEQPAQDPPQALMCTRSSDATYLQKWGVDTFQERYGKFGLTSIWDQWGPDSGILPCSVYLRHCVLAAKKQGTVVHDSFLDETFLSDRVMTVRQYLNSHPEVMDTPPPPALAARYSG